MFAGFPLLGCWINMKPKTHNFRLILDKEQLLIDKLQINLFLLWVLINYGPRIYMPNMEINDCSFRTARVFRGLHVYIDSDSCRIKKD